MCRDRMDKQRTLDFHLMSRMNRFVDRVTHLHDSQVTMKKVNQISNGGYHCDILFPIVVTLSNQV